MTKLVVILLACLAALALCYVLALRGRRNHPGWEKLEGWAYAHRGLHGGGVPENSLEAFRLALENGYGMELDVHLLRGGGLAVIHDSSLKRTAGADVKIEDLAAGNLENYRLEGTDEKIPQLFQVLELVQGKVPLIVELKTEKNNVARLCTAVCNVLEDYEGAYCIESFDPRCIHWLRKNRPDIIRGQLTENFLKSGGKMPWFLRFCLTTQLFNFLTLPDFAAYRFSHRKRLGNILCRRIWGIRGVSWTLQTPEEFAIAKREGWLPIFEGFSP